MLHVGHVYVAGNRSADSLRVIRTFEVFPGQLYSDEAVRRGIRKLFALGIFEDISTERNEHEGLVDLTIHVSERPRIAKFVFHGNVKKSTSDLEKKLQIRVGEAYSPSAVHTQVDTLLKLYTEDGYAQATVTPFADTLEDRHQVSVRFEVHEGEKVKISEIQVIGVTAVQTKVLRKQLKTKPTGLFGGGDVKDENFDTDRQKVEAYYHNHGYRDARVIDHQLKPGDTPKHLIYVITVDEGPQYRFGKITWTGATVVPTDELSRAWRPRMWSPYDASAVERAQGEAYASYAERGYLYLNVEPRETVRDSMVDIEFHVGEGVPSNVRFVNISGNKGTREKVIRRQLSIHEGERFRRSSLVRTQGDLMRLGLFEDVQMDFAPAESTDVDLNVKVKEKQVGTASAGAGYTSQNGLTGFVELGHNNVLGNAQVLQLHLERGGSSSNYLLSFTEPWFHDTPTLLGFSLYNSYLLRDYYREKRVGGSAQIGRPLTHPDYSHIAVAYRLENVTYDSLSTVVADQRAGQHRPSGYRARSAAPHQRRHRDVQPQHREQSVLPDARNAADPDRRPDRRAVRRNGQLPEVPDGRARLPALAGARRHHHAEGAPGRGGRVPVEAGRSRSGLRALPPRRWLDPGSAARLRRLHDRSRAVRTRSCRSASIRAPTPWGA